LDFAENHATALKRFKLSFPNATYLLEKGFAQGEVMTLLKGKGTGLRFHVKGTDFQLCVWRTLLCIPRGGLMTYGDIAELASNSKACRAVGSAVGDNPVSLLIPCHRVVLSSGELGNYAWGPERKAAILRWELE
jgi:AraC family transcriptional regulator of adaptative response/methylated-DNA-[protein]-cysteine methyltransferase